MSEALKHECGIALVRLRKPISYYTEKYGTPLYGMNKLYLLMEKQHNRGQEGAGLACIKLNAQPGNEYIFRERALGSGAIGECFAAANKAIAAGRAAGLSDDDMPYVGECYVGHLRYSTGGRNGMSYVHPFLRRNNWRSRNIVLAGNFSLTNAEELMAHVVKQGQHPRQDADMFLMLEQLGYMLDEQVEELQHKFMGEGYVGSELIDKIEDELNIQKIMREASSLWDGGFVIEGATGTGDCFVLRDKWGIRSAFYYIDDEVVIVASERPVIQTAMNLTTDQVKELKAGEGLFIKRDGEVSVEQVLEPAEKLAPCSFERIYFSRGSDSEIYRERKTLGRLLCDKILKEVDYDIDHLVLSFIPNTAEVAYYGMVEGMNDYMNRQKVEQIEALGANPQAEQIEAILDRSVRTEKLAIKDIKLRTFITEGASRNDLAAHVYDITYDTVTPGVDSIAVIDDSIVRGTTLKQSIIKILSRLNPKKIVIVSSSPQVRYPDYYGIDMSRMSEFIAFHAAVALLRERGMEQLLHDTYNKCLEQAKLPVAEMVNCVKDIYAPFTDDEITEQITKMLTPEDCTVPVSIVYQSIEGLHEACPNNKGDWYFSGDFPTAGGNRLVNAAYVAYYNQYVK
ncbi:MAG: amidophosphoribosyltransferase [Rikenellaceae bacterium]|nr:amidophosphoribosyltransferase [Rikenellaceae bacterium]MBQ5852825.1 amidophosphoribosyltransferase [Rikenellaceae bacterium]